jgi:hypothetical protein
MSHDTRASQGVGSNWLTMRTVSVGSGHGPISILFGVSRAGGGVTCVNLES